MEEEINKYFENLHIYNKQCIICNNTFNTIYINSNNNTFCINCYNNYYDFFK